MSVIAGLPLDILPSMSEAAEAKALDVSSNFSKDFNLITFLADSTLAKSWYRFSLCRSFFSSKSLKMAKPAGVSNNTSILVDFEGDFLSLELIRKTCASVLKDLFCLRLVTERSNRKLESSQKKFENAQQFIH